MSFGNGICAVVPLKDTSEAKQRLAGVLDLAQRRQLALAMFEQVLTTLGIHARACRHPSGDRRSCGLRHR